MRLTDAGRSALRREDSLVKQRDAKYRPPTLPDVLLEHLEELAILSIQRRKLLFDPDVILCEFLPHEGRIAAHWDGLVVGADDSVALAKERLDSPDPWDVYAAARVWIELGKPKTWEILERVATVDETAVPGWREALRRVPHELMRDRFPDGPPPGETSPVLDVLVFALGWHRLLPENVLTELVRHADHSVRRNAARTIGWGMVSPQKAGHLTGVLRLDGDQDVRRAALWSAALVVPDETASWCRDRIRSGEVDPFTVRVLGLLGGPEDTGLVEGLIASSRGAIPAAIRALGDLGDTRVVESLIEILTTADEGIRRAARYALQTLIGAALPRPRKSSTEALFEEEDEVPTTAALKAFWAEASRAYTKHERWLRGRPFPGGEDAWNQPMESLWRSSLLSPKDEIEWLRREVPDGFFTAEPEDEATAGV